MMAQLIAVGISGTPSKECFFITQLIMQQGMIKPRASVGFNLVFSALSLPEFQDNGIGPKT
jgi:hypothetical protein